MSVIRNPILRGFNPDPSIVRVGDDYYIATSTFEWFPGVRLHHSRDLVNWVFVGHALDETTGFSLHGIPDSGGVWAPSLSYAEGQFWLAYSIVRTMDGDDLDVENYVMTAPTITGPWSAPAYVGSRGFDFSLFHDSDGSHWLVGVQWDHRPDAPSFAGIVLEEYLPETRRASGVAHTIYSQTELVEGPNLYQVDGWYVLLLAEGGTGWNHGVTMARSRGRTGPYERDTTSAVLTSRDAPGIELQKAGHGELVQRADGGWMLVHLASRPAIAHGERYSILGRETCLQRVEFTPDGWLRLEGGWHHPLVQVESGLPELHAAAPPRRDDFDLPTLDTTRWSTLRAPLRGASLTVRPGWLRLTGGRSPGTVFDQSMVAQRVPELRVAAETLVDAEPTSSRQAAGLIAWYDRAGFAWLQLTWDAQYGRQLRLVLRDGSVTTRSAAVAIADGPVRMRLDLDGGELRFSAASARGGWIAIGENVDAWKLSDDHSNRLRFTGLMVGMRCEDLDGVGWFADFDYFEQLP